MHTSFMRMSAKDLVMEAVSNTGESVALKVSMRQIKDLTFEAAQLLLRTLEIQAHTQSIPTKDHIANYFIGIHLILDQEDAAFPEKLKELHRDALVILGAHYTKNEALGISALSPDVLGALAGMLAQSVKALAKQTGEDPIELLRKL